MRQQHLLNIQLGLKLPRERQQDFLKILRGRKLPNFTPTGFFKKKILQDFLKILRGRKLPTFRQQDFPKIQQDFQQGFTPPKKTPM